MAEHPKAVWFRDQASQCIGRALGALDPRIKRLHALEAERWLRLADLKPESANRQAAPDYKDGDR
jgi:hypothetical protein